MSHTTSEAQVVDFQSAKDGFYPPRMTTSQRDSISVDVTISDGLLIYNITTGNINYYSANKAKWVELVPREYEEVTDIDNNVYKTVTIGTQTWMAENLQVTRYNDGTPISLVTIGTFWQDAANAGTPAYTTYENTASQYGALYNWYVTDSVSNGDKNVCPVGWHVATHVEWNQMTNFLGGLSAGGKIKMAGFSHWKPPNAEASNESGFSAVPGGVRAASGNFSVIGGQGYYWTSTAANTDEAWLVLLHSSNGSVSYVDIDKGIGSSIRCLQD